MPLLLAVVEAPAAANDEPAPRLSGLTEQGLYQVVIQPETPSVPMRELHTWVVEIRSQFGSVTTLTNVVVGGGMPGHGHGFTSEPRVIEELGEGRYQIAGMRFHMSGEWLLRIGISGSAGSDHIDFAFHLTDDGLLASQKDLGDDAEQAGDWTSQQIAILRSLSLESLPAQPSSPSNRVARNAAAIEFGRELFFEKALSRNGRVACASCHRPDKYFSDGLPLSQGLATTTRHAPSLVGAAYRPFLYWDGRKDSLWSQALAPFEADAEMGITRLGVISRVNNDERLRRRYESVFSESLPSISQGKVQDAGPYGNEQEKAAWFALSETQRRAISGAFANIGKAIAAFERTLVHQPTRFDRYATALDEPNETTRPELSDDEQAGLALFLDVGKTGCLRCHNGPLMTNQSFHNIGTGTMYGAGTLDFGRLFGLQALLIDEFNCLGRYSDAEPENCSELDFRQRSQIPETFSGAFKVPTLRNVGLTAPYMHDGRFETLEEVMQHYVDPPVDAVETGELSRLTLSDQEVAQIIAFLRLLDEPLPAATSQPH